MTDPNPPARGGDEDTISKFMKRMKTVVKRGTRSNRNSVSNMSEITGESSKPATSNPKKAVEPTTTKKVDPAPVGHWSNTQQEKARALFAKYGLTLEPEEWVSKPRHNWDPERVEKPIRMRVRRNCHRCQTTFGADKICSNCQHPRCKKCPRYPVAKTPEEKEAKAKAKAAAAKEAMARKGAKPANPPLTIPSRTGGQDLVRKPAMQRVRRNCHLCQSLFVGDSKECAICHHIRCKKCPRDPPKFHKYPDGYPGDAEPPIERPQRVWQKPRRRVRWTCHDCSKMFLEGERQCSKCGHDRCKECTRDPPKKVKPAPDPEIVRRVEEKLAKLDLAT
ncbi:hypothetical protein FQN54_006148 [Arachnomyces sp. PD_36]|nr:hypothetical protein FQN54_006148 [Arachnomyces sp. PD_36]